MRASIIVSFVGTPATADLEFTAIDALYAQPGRRGETPGLYARFARTHPGDSRAATCLYRAALVSLDRGDVPAEEASPLLLAVARVERGP